MAGSWLRVPRRHLQRGSEAEAWDRWLAYTVWRASCDSGRAQRAEAERKAVPSPCFTLVHESSSLTTYTLSSPGPPTRRQTSATAWTIPGNRSLPFLYVSMPMCSYTHVCWFCSSGSPNADSSKKKLNKRNSKIKCGGFWTLSIVKADLISEQQRGPGACQCNFL